MGVLRWIGCIAAAIIVLAVFAGIAVSFVVLAGIVVAVVVVGGLVYLTAALIKSLWEEVFS